MYYLFLILPLPILFGISLYFNNKKYFGGTGNKIIVSILEGIGMYLIISSVLLEGFIGNIFLQITIFVIGFIVLIISNNRINELEPEFDDQIETIKNLLVIFASTILLFYVLLSVFRFQPFYLQFLYAIIGTIIFNVLAHYMKKITSELYDRLDFSNFMFVTFRIWYVYLGVFGLIFIIVFLNMPKVAINNFVNLNNSKAYFVYPNGSNRLTNRYEAEEIFDVIIDERIDTTAYLNHDGDNLFIYANNSVTIYNLQEKRILYTGDIQANVNGINIPIGNQEYMETRYRSDCTELSNCVEYDYSFVYGSVKYNNGDPIFKFDSLNYNNTNTAIFSEGVLHLFEDDDVDSKINTNIDKAFLGFGDSLTVATDVDYYEGKLEYLQVNREGDHMNIKVYSVVERDIDLNLPFYSHYRFGMLVFILLMGAVPISNYGLGRPIFSKKNKS